MRFAFTAEQDALREVVRDFLQDRAPLRVTRQHLGNKQPYDADVWSQLCEQLGLAGLHVAEDLGGQGYSYVELGIALEELGRVLYSGPFLTTAALALPLLLASGAGAELVTDMAHGRSTGTAALFEQPHQQLEPADVSATWDEVNGTVSGRKRFVPHGAASDIAVLLARRPGTQGPDGIALLAVELAGPGVHRQDLDGMDLTRPVADLQLDHAPATTLADPTAGWELLQRTLPVAAACLAAELLGGAQACLDAAVAYVSTREQFGVPVGSFQAVQHQCADLLVAIENARSSTYHALWAVSTGEEEPAVSASIALNQMCAVFQEAARRSIQLHGGIGFTWEHDAHLYFRRAAAAPALLGSAGYHRRRVAELLGV